MLNFNLDGVSKVFNFHIGYLTIFCVKVKDVKCLKYFLAFIFVLFFDWVNKLKKSGTEVFRPSKIISWNGVHNVLFKERKIDGALSFPFAAGLMLGPILSSMSIVKFLLMIMSWAVNIFF